MPNSLSGSTGQGFQYLAPAAPGSVESSGGIQQLNFRDPLDATRSGMAGFVPGADYPSGYLGTIQSRREDRFLDNLKKQVGDRSYQRGVHRGERLDPQDYFWPSELQDDRGLRRQAMAQPQPDGTLASPRYTPLGTVAEQMVVSGATELPTSPRGKMRPAPTVYETRPEVAVSLRNLLPVWR